MEEIRLKVTHPKFGTMIVGCASKQSMEEWLRIRGFFHVNGVYKNLDGSVVGILPSTSNPQVERTCNKPLKTKSRSFLWNKK